MVDEEKGTLHTASRARRRSGRRSKLRNTQELEVDQRNASVECRRTNTNQTRARGQLTRTALSSNPSCGELFQPADYGQYARKAALRRSRRPARILERKQNGDTNRSAITSGRAGRRAAREELEQRAAVAGRRHLRDRHLDRRLLGRWCGRPAPRRRAPRVLLVGLRVPARGAGDGVLLVSARFCFSVVQGS